MTQIFELQPLDEVVEEHQVVEDVEDGGDLVVDHVDDQEGEQRLWKFRYIEMKLWMLCLHLKKTIDVRRTVNAKAPLRVQLLLTFGGRGGVYRD